MMSDNGDDTGTGFVVAGGFAHPLLDGVIGEASEIPQKLALAAGWCSRAAC